MKTIKLRITNPKGLSHTYFDVVKNEYVKGINHITLANGTSFKINTWDGWKLVVLD